MSYLGSHRPRLRWFRLALALSMVLGLFAAGAVPTAFADDDDEEECSSSFGGGLVVLDDDCDDDDDGDDDGDDDASSSSGSRAGRRGLILVEATCTYSPAGTTYVFDFKTTRQLRASIATMRILDVTDGTRILSSSKPVGGRHIVTSGTVDRRVGRMGLGLVDVRDRYVKLLTVRCTAA